MAKISSDYKISQGFKYEGDDWWRWWVWIEADETRLDEIDNVVYTLHPTFHEPVRKVTDRKSKFKLETDGWGTFTIYAKVVLTGKKEITLKHELHLEYPDGKVNNE